MGLKTDPPIPMVAARIVTDSRGPFANTRLANAGYEKGVKVGHPVMSENGLVGRIIGVTNGASRVLLTTDTASKIPVMIDRTNARAILQGDGGPNPKLDYLRGQAPVKEGDRVMTSGDGGVMPRGLPVGTAVKGLDGRWRVVLAADKAPIDFVRILLFEDFTQLVNQKELAEKHVPPPTEGAQTIGVSPPVAQVAAPIAPGTAKPAAAPTAGAPAATTPAKPATTPAAKPADAKPAAATAKAPATTAAAAKTPATGGAAKPPATKGASTPAKTEAKAAAAKPSTPKTPAAKPAAPKTAPARTTSSKAVDQGGAAEPPH
jgi:rod shape-determining protein MreC